MAWKCPECEEINRDDSIARCICGYEIKNDSGSSELSLTIKENSNDYMLESESNGTEHSFSIKEDDIAITSKAGRDIFVAIIIALVADAILDVFLPNNEFISYATWVIAQCIIIHLLQQKYPLKRPRLGNVKSALDFTLIAGLIIFGFYALGHFALYSVVPDDYELFIKYDLTLKALFFINAIVIAPIVEETLFRGYFYRILKMRYGIFFALLFSGALWSSVHNFSAASLFQGFILTIIYEKTDNLWYCMIAHSMNNIAYSIFYYLL